MAEPRPSRALLIFLVVVVLVAASVGAGLLYEYNHGKPTAPARLVRAGDNVTVNYIGMIGAGPQTGRVFDTSLYSVATNNVSYPKSLEFALRGSASQYSPLAVHVGPSGSYSVAGLTFGPVVTGFWQGLLGLPVNRTVAVTFPYSLGYGPVVPACSVTAPLHYTVPVTLSMTPHDFALTYLGVNATPGTEFTDPTYGWSDLVLSENASAVVIENLPALGFSVPGVGWTVLVTSTTTTTITLTNELTSAQAGLVLGHTKGSNTCGSSRFIVTGVNSAAGTFTEQFDYSSTTGQPVPAELQGATFTFIVTIVQFY